ncbi:MAG: carbamoyltransferase [Magnetococcus sp. DMHC-1]|nr:carbamoyltransferase [Magnetococcales bacterium]
MRILGISAFYHDSAAALVRDGSIVAAAQEERFTRKKHDPEFPRHAVEFCLAREGVTLKDVDYVAFYDKPFLKFERLLETYLTFAPRGFKSFLASMPVWIKEKLFQKRVLTHHLTELGGQPFPEERLLFLEHHQSHAASAFYPSPFRSALVLTMDGVGEWTTTSAAIGNGNRLEIFKEIHFPHSLGLLYSAFTYYTGFRVNSGEYKVMGLAPYGEPRYAAKIFEHLLDLKADGSFRLNMDYFDYCTGLTMTNAKFAQLFGGPPRDPDDPLEQRHMDLATSVQVVIEEALLRLTRALGRETGQKNLCLAGGVALNCVANGKVLQDGQFEAIWIQPASGDAGGALGAALGAYYGFQGQTRLVQGETDAMQGSYLGPDFSRSDIEQRLTAEGAVFHTLSDPDLLEASVTDLAAGKALGWFQGRMEFGPRALGNRSILGDPRSPSMQTTLNLKVKFRESFRPFAPSILREDVADWFNLNGDSPYMLLVDEVAAHQRLPKTAAADQLFGIEKLKLPRSTIPAVTHVDYSARIQTVHRETNPRYHALLSHFKARTGCPVLVNTSFNVRGEPIVCTPEDAFQRFMRTHIETLVVGNCLLRKEDQKPSQAPPIPEYFAPD